MRDQGSIWEQRHAGGFRGEQTAIATDFAHSLAVRLPESAGVLELGFGEGEDAAYFASLGHDVLATEISGSAVSKASTRYAGIPNLRFQQHDTAEPFDLPDAGLDAIFARLSLHYFSQAQTVVVFAELARLLHPGGLLAFMCKSTEDPLCGKGTQLEPDVFESSHLRHFFSEPYTRALLAPWFEVESLVAKQGKLYDSPSAWLEVIGLRR